MIRVTFSTVAADCRSPLHEASRSRPHCTMVTQVDPQPTVDPAACPHGVRRGDWSSPLRGRRALRVRRAPAGWGCRWLRCRERRFRDISDASNGPFGTLNVLNGPFATSTHVPNSPFTTNARHGAARRARAADPAKPGFPAKRGFCLPPVKSATTTEHTWRQGKPPNHRPTEQQPATQREQRPKIIGGSRLNVPKAPPDNDHPATDVPTWPAYTPRNRATMWLDAECEIVNDPDKDERLFWKKHA
jgi:hypothetical protein